MFGDNDSDSDREDFTNYDGYIGSKEIKKISKKAKLIKSVSRANRDPEDSGDSGDEGVEGVKRKAQSNQEEPKAEDAERPEGPVDEEGPNEEEEGYGARFNPYTAYMRVEEIIDPSENMTSDKLSTFDYSSIVSLEIARADQEGYTFIPVGNMTNTTDIAESTINARKCPFLIYRKVGFRVDHAEKKIIDYVEIHDPNQMIFPEMNATYKL